MTPIYQWAQRNNVPRPVLDELLLVLGLNEPIASKTPVILTYKTEVSVMQQVRLEATRRGARLFRNNVGVATEDGRVIRYGLCNESSQVNNVCKSSDLIGITPVVCGCGQRYGVFTAYEVKKPTWKFLESDKRAVAQLNFVKLINSLGGIARFIKSVDDL